MRKVGTLSRDQSESLTLSLFLFMLLFSVCQSLSLSQREITNMTLIINVVYISVIILMIFNIGALRAVSLGEDFETWMNDEGIEIIFFSILISLLINMGFFISLIKFGSLV